MGTFILGIIVGVVVALILFFMFNPKKQQHEAVEKQLAATKTELEAQHEHFAKSEELLTKMAHDFKSLYQHMGENSKSTLPLIQGTALILENENEPEQLTHEPVSATTDNTLIPEENSTVSDPVQEVSEPDIALNSEEEPVAEAEKSAIETTTETDLELHMDNSSSEKTENNEDIQETLVDQEAMITVSAEHPKSEETEESHEETAPTADDDSKEKTL